MLAKERKEERKKDLHKHRSFQDHGGQRLSLSWQGELENDGTRTDGLAAMTLKEKRYT